MNYIICVRGRQERYPGTHGYRVTKLKIVGTGYRPNFKFHADSWFVLAKKTIRAENNHLVAKIRIIIIFVEIKLASLPKYADLIQLVAELLLET